MLVKSSKLIGEICQVNDQIEMIEGQTIKVDLSIQPFNVESTTMDVKYDADVYDIKAQKIILNRSIVFKVEYEQYADVEQVVEEHKIQIMDYLAGTIQQELQQVSLGFDKEKEVSSEKEYQDIEKHLN